MNDKAKLAIKKAYGFKSYKTLETALYHQLGKPPDFLWFIAVVAICTASWNVHQNRGWMATVIGMTAIAYFLTYYRCRPRLVPSAFLMLPFVAFVLFLLALVMGLRHQPSVRWMLMFV